MKTFAKILLILLSIPLSLLWVFFVNIRFQFLDSRFWINAFEKGNIYSQISGEINKNLESRAVGEGGNASDVADISSLISEKNVKLFFEENIQSVVMYANGKTPEVIITFPFTNDLWSYSRKMELNDFLEENNIEIISRQDLNRLSDLGSSSWIAFASLSFLLILIYFLMYVLTKPGRRLVALGLSLVLMGIVTISLFIAGKFAVSVILRDFIGSSNLGKSIAAITAIPIIINIIQVWIYVGASTFILGILLFFIKKPVYNLKQ